MPKIADNILGSWELVDSRLYDAQNNFLVDLLAGSTGTIIYLPSKQMAVQICREKLLSKMAIEL